MEYHTVLGEEATMQNHDYIVFYLFWLKVKSFDEKVLQFSIL